MNNKNMSKIAELMAKNERSKLDIDKIFPREQIMDMFIYELTRIEDKNTSFTYNSNKNVINIAGVANEIKAKFYMESESQEIFTLNSAQSEISDIKNVMGYIKEELDWENKSYIICPTPFNENNDLKQVYAITLSKEYDKYSKNDVPTMRRVEVRNIIIAFNETYDNRILLKKYIDVKSIVEKANPGYEMDSYKVDKLEIKFSNNNAGLCSLNVFDGRRTVDFKSENSMVPIPVIPIKTIGKDVDIYLPTFDKQTNQFNDFSLFGSGSKLIWGLIFLKTTEPLRNLLFNILSISQMMVRGFEGVKEKGHVPGHSSKPITPSAGWFWKKKLDGKNPKAASAVIQNYINNALSLINNGEMYNTSIDSLNPYGNIEKLTKVPSEENYIYFYSVLNLFSTQLFSNYSFNYGGTFDGASIFPISLEVKSSMFEVGVDGSEMLKLSMKNFGPNIKNNFAKISGGSFTNYSNTQLAKIDTFWADSKKTSIASMGLYIIDYKYAEKIYEAYSANTTWREAQARMISSPHAVKIGVPLDAQFFNGCSWQSSKIVSGVHQIPISVFQNMDNPVFYHASFESEIDEQANYVTTYKTHQQAHDLPIGGWFRGYPKVPFAAEIKANLKGIKNPQFVYEVNLVSQFDDDAGPANDYSFGVQNFTYKLKDVPTTDLNKIDKYFETGVNKAFTIGGIIPYQKPNAIISQMNLAKTLGENTKNILNAPTVFMPFDNMNAYGDVIEKTKKPFHTMSDMFGKFDMKYLMNKVDKNEVIDNLSAIEISFLGNDSIEITVDIIIELKKGGSKKEISMQFPIHTKSKSITGIFDNKLYLEPSEDFIDTYALINLGDK